MGIYVEYNNSPTLINFCNQLQSALTVVSDSEVSQFCSDWLSISTATTAGLDNWGIILGQNRLVPSGSQYYKLFGFNNPPNTVNQSPQNFNNGGFDPGSGTYISLEDTAYRALLQLLYSKYSTNNTLASLNIIIQNYAQQTSVLYPTRNKNSVYVNEVAPMAINYFFLPSFNIQPYETNLFDNSNVLAKPAGVRLTLNYSRTY